MGTTSHPVRCITDHIQLAGHVLQALESGRMRMHAADYQEISGWASAEFAKMDTPALWSLRDRVPGPLKAVVENLLFLRAERWTEIAIDQLIAATTWSALHDRLRRTT